MQPAMMATMTSTKNSSPVLPDTPESSDEIAAEKAFVDAGLSMQRFPQSAQEKDLVDKLLAHELEKLSFEEKERVAFDIHGISHEGQDPANVDALLLQMEQEILKIPNRRAYEQAKYLDEDYVQDRDFRLMFLRCDEFDVKVAAHRIVSHFEVKKSMFGDGPVLGRDLCMSDLHKDDVLALQAGCWQLLPVRDAAGRLVVFHSPDLRDDAVTNDNMAHSIFYFIFILMRQEDVQRNGLVIVSWWNEGIFGKWGTISDLRSTMKKHRAGMPRKIASLHVCTPKDHLRPLVAGIAWFLRADTRARMRMHFGGLEKMKFELQTFGIPTDCLPMFPDGSPNQENHHQWIVSQRKREEEGGTKDDIIVPCRFDVLFGRGHHTRNHTGNMRAAHIVDMFRDKYEMAGRHEKTTIAERIVGLIRESHGRFLRWEDDAWVEVDLETARKKISCMYRNTRKKKDVPSDQGSKSKASPSPVGLILVGDDSDKKSPACSLKRTQPEPFESLPVPKRSPSVV